jgi:hypothetical protein
MRKQEVSMNDSTNQWGSDQKYYAELPSMQQKKNSNRLDLYQKNIIQILNNRFPDLEERVYRTYRQWNNILRDYLRSETALRLSVGDDIQSVPINITAGMPQPFHAIISGQEKNLEFLLHKPLITTTRDGLKYIENNYAKVAEFVNNGDANSETVSDEELKKTLHFLDRIIKKLDLIDFIQKIKNIKQDILGAYFFNHPKIELYYIVIGIMAAMLDVSPESLTVVVLIHELTHAYTHLGKDIDGSRWETKFFKETDLQIVEGFAQFYTMTLSTRQKPHNLFKFFCFLA